MPDSLQFNDFSAGWCPSDDPIKGRRNALMKLDNLELDQNGAMTLIGGTNKVGTFYNADIHTLYSAMIGGLRVDYAAAVDSVVYRSGTALTGTGSAARAAFSTAFKYTLICSGDLRLKDVGSGTPDNLGVKPPTAAPTFSSTNILTVQYSIPVGSLVRVPTYSGTPPAITGGAAATYFGTYLQMDSDPVTGIYIGQSYNVSNIPFNWDTYSSFHATNNDILYLEGYEFYPDTDTLQLDIILETPGATPTQVNNYYTIIPNQVDYHFDKAGGRFRLKLRRGDFEKIGPAKLDWQSVCGFRITYTTTRLGSGPAYMRGSGGSNGLNFYGGDQAQKGVYEYAQMFVNNTGTYLAKSIIGPKSDLVEVDMLLNVMNIKSPVGIDAQVTETWIFRRAVDGLGLLDQWYRVGVVPLASFGGSAADISYVDILRDEDALILNITVNRNLVSIASTSISDAILDIIGPINGRWYYFTNNYMYPSEINNPDLVDATLAIKFTASDNEKFMWARQIAEGVILVATSLDIHILTGTFATLPDFTIDIYYRSLSVKYPPISIDVAVFSGTAFYMAGDGWRSLDANGANRSLVAPNTDRLYRNINCQGYIGVNVKVPPGLVRFPVCIGNNKLWCFITGNKRIEIWDFHRQYWRVIDLGATIGDATACFSSPDGQILVAFKDKYIRTLDYQVNKLIDGSSSQSFVVQTPVLDGGAPRRRKDSYTFKLRAQITGAPVTISILTDDGINHTLSTIPVNTLVTDNYIDLKTYFDKAKTFQIQISGSVTDIVIEDMQIYYDLLPEQLSYLRFRPEDYGSSGRKRLFDIPFVIDTLGNNVIFKPIVDDVVQNSLTVNSNRKKVFQYNFKEDINTHDIIKGFNYEYDISCSTGLFEFYGFLPPKTIEILPEQLSYFKIRSENFGSLGLKRLFTVPFMIDTLGNVVTITPTIDDIIQPPFSVSCLRKKSFIYEFPLNQITNDIVKGIDYDFDIRAAAGLFEWYGFLPSKHIELLPEPIISYVIPTTDFGTAAKKRMRVWPFVINTRGQNVTFVPIVDGVRDNTNISLFNTTDYITVRHYFKTDVFGVDYSGTFSAPGQFELGAMLTPEFVQILPIAKRFDQVGPEEFFREGKITQFEVRLLPYGGEFGTYTQLPYMIFMNDASIETGILNVVNGVEATYFVAIPKGVVGNILRFELGPTDWDFHRFYCRFKVIQGGSDTEQNWVTVPSQG